MEFEASKAIILGDGECDKCGHVIKAHNYIYLVDFGDEIDRIFSSCSECSTPFSIPKKVKHHYIGNEVEFNDDDMEEFIKASEVAINILKELGLT